MRCLLPSLLLSVCGPLSVGCSGGAGPSGPAQDSENLTAIYKAYAAATDRLARPPKNVEELKPSLKADGDVDRLLVSPNDKLPYVIVYGADPRKHVVAYEQKGIDGVRMVVDQLQLPRRLSQEQFEDLTFPPGHKIPAAGK